MQTILWSHMQLAEKAGCRPHPQRYAIKQVSVSPAPEITHSAKTANQLLLAAAAVPAYSAEHGETPRDVSHSGGLAGPQQACCATGWLFLQWGT